MPFNADSGINYTVADIFTATGFTCPALLQSLYRAKNNVPVWRYRYMPRFPSVTPYKWMRGAVHASEIAFVFGTLDVFTKKPEAVEIAASKYLQRVWVEFAKDPVGGLTALGWPRYTLKPKGWLLLIPISGMDLV